MKNLIKTAAATLVLSIALPAFANVDPKIHKLCIEAKDYAGCVRAMNGEVMPTSRLIKSQGADMAEGNKCPAGFAYIGGGNCQEVKCQYHSSSITRSMGHDSLIAGLRDKDGKDVWGCKNNFWVGAGTLRLVGAIIRSTNDINCPAGEPKLGFNSTCQTAERDWIRTKEAKDKAEKEGPKCDFKLQKYGCSFDTYLEANPGMKMWAELNPEMADKERIKLQSID